MSDNDLPTTPKALSRAIIRSEKTADAFELIKEGKSYRDIARELDISPETARKYVKEAMESLAEAEHATAAGYRSLLIERNNLARKGLYPGVKAGDPAAVNAWIKLNQEEAKLFGLYAPDKFLKNSSDKPINIINIVSELQGMPELLGNAQNIIEGIVRDGVSEDEDED